MKHLILVLCLISVALLFVGCKKAGGGDERPLDEYLLGKWTMPGMHTYSFNDDGTVTVDDDQTYQWGIDTEDTNLLLFQFSIDANQVKVSKTDPDNMVWSAEGEKYKLKRMK
jgi:hypothetical protein